MGSRNDDRILVAGFVEPKLQLKDGELKLIAARMRARSVAVSLALEQGVKVSVKRVADQLGVSERNLFSQFRCKNALLAFPPPEMACAIGRLAITGGQSSGFVEKFRPMFASLDTNTTGRRLLCDLVELRHRHPELDQSDAYFSTELRAVLDPSGLAADGVAGYITDGARKAMRNWSMCAETSTMVLGDALAELFESVPFLSQPGS